VLGSGRNLSPAQAISPQPPAHHRRNASFLSPSESSVSLSSQTSNSPASTAEPREDISSKVLLGPSDNAAASASSRLVCPICNEEMVCHNACPTCSQCTDMAGHAAATEQVGSHTSSPPSPT
jgi:rabenosyn-5